jgi:von Willebrand factor type A domain
MLRSFLVALLSSARSREATARGHAVVFLAGIAAAGSTVLAACGADRPPLSTGEGTTTFRDAGPVFDLDGAPVREECGKFADGGPCGCVELSLLTDVPNLYFIVDRSGSMADGGKLSAVRVAIGSVVSKLGPRASVGAALFPDARAGPCSAGAEVMPVRRGDAPAGKGGPTTLTLLATTNVAPSGGTPTATTVRALTEKLASLKGRTYAILATDGGPNCNELHACDVSQCMANIESAPGCPPNAQPNCCDPTIYGPGNCLDGEATIDAVAALHAAGVSTYVIGVPGSGAYASLLDQMAEVGGTARATSPKYFRVDTTDESSLDLALAQIAAKTTGTCFLPLSPDPPDPNRVNVYLDDVVVPKDPANGWKLEDATVTLLGTTCARVLAGEVLSLRVVSGCPTVPPK